MKRSEFLRILKNDVSFMLGSGYEYQLKTMYKNNGIKADVIIISKAGESVGKTFAINYDGADGHDEIYNKAWYIVDDYEKSINVDKNINIDINESLEWKMSKDLVTFMLVNLKANKERLEHMPHVILSDLAMIFKISIQTEEGILTTWVDNDLLAEWDIDINELPEIARQNTMKRHPAIMVALDDIIESINPKFKSHKRVSGMDLYFLTNRQLIDGAAVVFYVGLLKNVADYLDSDLILIPSCIHGIIAVKKDDDVDYTFLQCMLIDINKNKLPLEDVLSNNLYEYTRQDDKIRQVTDCDLEINNDLF